MFDLCIVGHITKDVIRLYDHDKEERMPGGTAYYMAIALKSLGMNIAVVTKMNERDTSLVSRLKTEGIFIFQRQSRVTTTFVNLYTEDTDEREQWVVDVALPFTIDDVRDVDAKIFHLGPLTKGDIPLEVLESLAARSEISLDVQGFVRELQRTDGEWSKIKLADWEEKGAALPLVSILKANEEEARILDGVEDLQETAVELSRYGPAEVIITRGSKPSLIYSKEQSYWVPAFPPNRLVDPTGCGDTYMAGYLFLRSKGTNPEEAGRFAAMMASLKLESHGPVRSTEEGVRAYAQANGYSLSSMG